MEGGGRMTREWKPTDDAERERVIKELAEARKSVAWRLRYKSREEMNATELDELERFEKFILDCKANGL